MTETQTNGGTPWGHIPPGALRRPEANIPQPEGPFNPGPGPRQPNLDAVPDSFDADDVWNFTFNFRKYAPKGKEVKGEVPAPTQERIDRFERAMSVLYLEERKAAEDAARAQSKVQEAQAEAEVEDEETDIEPLIAALDDALSEKARVLDRIRDVLADVCGGHPTRKQFDLLPENALKHFVNVLGKKLNPEG